MACEVCGRTSPVDRDSILALIGCDGCSGYGKLDIHLLRPAEERDGSARPAYCPKVSPVGAAVLPASAEAINYKGQLCKACVVTYENELALARGDSEIGDPEIAEEPS